MEPELYDLDVSGTEEEAIDREWERARARQLVGLWHVVAPLVRTIIALVVAMGAKSVREALALAKRVFAPVDVGQGAETLLAAIHSAYEPEEVREEVMPFVEDRARLAREVARLRAEIESLTRGVTHYMTVAAIHRAEVARLTADLDSLAADAGQALCAATLRPGETITDQRPHAIVALVVGLVAEKHAQAAEIARLTAVIVVANNVLAEVCHGDHEHQIECHADTLPGQYRRVAVAAETALDALAPIVMAMVEAKLAAMGIEPVVMRPSPPPPLPPTLVHKVSGPSETTGACGLDLLRQVNARSAVIRALVTCPDCLRALATNAGTA